jgi:hypothetical protein
MPIYGVGFGPPEAFLLIRHCPTVKSIDVGDNFRNNPVINGKGIQNYFKTNRIAMNVIVKINNCYPAITMVIYAN